ncbi:MAG: aminopeptidase [Leptospiraceae bacterium]|nr:aminopeptidase [Leptospiraceae bacterium]
MRLFPSLVRWQLILLLLLPGTNQCVAYLGQATMGQLEIMWYRRPIESVIQDPATPKEMRAKLLFIESVREFARQKMHLQVDQTYQQITILDRDSLAWNVSASDRLQFQALEYYFPIVGTVPYLGYFDKKDAVAKVQELEGEGYDVALSEIGAYSTLGWFDDPLISTQLKASRPYLAELLIHECSHATIWFTDDVRFNESFANFTGQQGALEFLQHSWGAKDPRLQKMLIFHYEQIQLRQWFRDTARALENNYASNLDDRAKLLAKAKIIAAFQNKLRSKQLEMQVLNLQPLIEKKLNNAHFLAWLRYNSGQAFFQETFSRCSGDWSCFLTKIRSLRDLDKEERKKLLL